MLTKVASSLCEIAELSLALDEVGKPEWMFVLLSHTLPFFYM